MRGYTARCAVGKSAAMPRIALLVVVLIVVVGGLVFLSTVPKQQPTHTIEVDVPQGNAH